MVEKTSFSSLGLRSARAALALMVIMGGQYVLAADFAREQRMAEEIEDAILDGEPVSLKAKEREFFNIYTPSEVEPARGAAIILHGRGFHPDWEDVVQPLRVGLTLEGWNTLSMQMPVLEKGAKYYDYVPVFPEAFPRIEAGIDYLLSQARQNNSSQNIVLIAHSCSVHMSMAWIEAGRMRDISSYVGIGMGATDYKQKMQKPFPLDKMTIPLLDIYGAEEYPAVLRGAEARLRLINKAGNKKSSQQVVPGADHYFKDKGDALTTAVAAWLKTL